jgi:hypothetical protein
MRPITKRPSVREPAPTDVELSVLTQIVGLEDLGPAGVVSDLSWHVTAIGFSSKKA